MIFYNSDIVRTYLYFTLMVLSLIAANPASAYIWQARLNEPVYEVTITEEYAT